MSTVYTPNSAGDPVESYTEPDDGDAPDVASVNVFLEGLADDLARVHLGGDLLTIDTRFFPLIPVVPAATMTFDTDDALLDNSALSTVYVFAVDFPHGATVTTVSVWVDPVVHVAAPATPIAVSFWRRAGQTGVRTQIGSTVTDATAWPAYDAAHAVHVTGLTEAINKDLNSYVIRFRGEGGLNALAGLRLAGISWNGTARALHSKGG